MSNPCAAGGGGLGSFFPRRLFEEGGGQDGLQGRGGQVLGVAVDAVALVEAEQLAEVGLQALVGFRRGLLEAAIGDLALVAADPSGERLQEDGPGADRQLLDAFADLGGIDLMPQATYGRHTNWLSVFLIDEERFGAKRDELLSALAAENIEARPVWKPLHIQPIFASCERIGGAVAEDLFARGICLPSSSNLTAAEQARVIEVVRNVARHRDGTSTPMTEKTWIGSGS